ncbi:MAG: hypothetical protein J7L34_03945 [Thermotogaceae bacterium]|nr:hypothetical protein [Thermotogaceae bacterium]
MIVIKYPLSWNVAKKLKKGDVVKYSGKIVFVSKKALYRMENYMKLEGKYPYDVMGEVVFVKDNSPVFLESLYRLGVSGVIKEKALDISKNTKALIERFQRPMFEVEKMKGKEQIKLYPDLNEDAIKEIWVDSLEMEVI